MNAVAIDRVLKCRAVLALTVSAIGGTLGLRAFPFPADHAVLALVRLERPLLFAELTYTYAALWFSSVFFLASIGFSCCYIFVGRSRRASVTAPLPPYPAPEQRTDLVLVLGEQHHRTSPVCVEQPSWLTIPERGPVHGPPQVHDILKRHGRAAD